MGHLIETGTKLELKKIRHVDTMEEVCYVSRFLYQQSTDEAVIEMPVKGGSLVALEPEELFQVCFYTTKGLYQCQAQVTSRRYEDSIPVAIIKFRSEFEKLQRRQYYRMECLLQMEFRPITEEEYDEMLYQKTISGNELAEKDTAENGEEGTQTRFFNGVALDISGGGVRFNAAQPAESGDIIAIRIAFLSEEARKLRLLFAKVLTVAPVQNRSGMFEHRVEFVSISNMERESIIRYIFLEERKRRKKEAGFE